MKTILVASLEGRGLGVVNLGTHSVDPVDYPIFGYRMALCLAQGTATRGILVCGTGIGIAMAANRYPHVRAAVCHDIESTRLARQHNNANVLALGARLIDPETALQCLSAFLSTPFSAGRHVPRVDMLANPDDLR